jgi:hypothetical protein
MSDVEHRHVDYMRTVRVRYRPGYPEPTVSATTSQLEMNGQLCFAVVPLLGAEHAELDESGV